MRSDGLAFQLVRTNAWSSVLVFRVEALIGLLDIEASSVDIVYGNLIDAAATTLCQGGWVLAPGPCNDEDAAASIARCS